jgi:hypothetical protein
MVLSPGTVRVQVQVLVLSSTSSTVLVMELVLETSAPDTVTTLLQYCATATASD